MDLGFWGFHFTLFFIVITEQIAQAFSLPIQMRINTHAHIHKLGCYLGEAHTMEGKTSIFCTCDHIASVASAFQSPGGIYCPVNIARDLLFLYLPAEEKVQARTHTGIAFRCEDQTRGSLGLWGMGACQLGRPTSASQERFPTGM